MPSTASSFVIGMATALAIAGGFAGTFIEDVSKQRATDRALREPPKATALNAMRPLMTRNDGAILRGPINDSDPSTSGLAPPPANRLDMAQPARTAAADKGADTSANGAAYRQQPAASPQKKARKQHPVRKKPKLEWYEDESVVANRNRGGLFGMFR